MPQTAGTSLSAPLEPTRSKPPTGTRPACAGFASTLVNARNFSANGGRLGKLLTALFACGLVLLSGCERTDSVQRGYRGTGTLQYYTPSQVAAAAKLNEIPPPEPSDPYDPDIPLATEVNENVQVLTDLNALEFARLMQAMSTWVAPKEGCVYCHNVENLASDEKYTKVVSREMLKMTRDINTNWKSHVVNTGVTCWTCHRGKAVPSDIWFTTPQPKTPSAGISGNKAGQNTAGVKINGNSSLPFDPLTPFLAADTQIAVQGTSALPYGNRQSIKQTEWTYSLMMYMSKSLGVNCTYCHHTRAMGVWDQSSPQRVTAWHGIRMVRALNGDYLEPLKPHYPAHRLGPGGDAPKAACATCHKGAYKPLFGVSMLGDYPSLAGVIPGRLKPVEEVTTPESEAATDVGEAVVIAADTGAAAAEPTAAEESAAASETPPSESVASEAGPADVITTDATEVQALTGQVPEPEVAEPATVANTTTQQAESTAELVTEANAAVVGQEEGAPETLADSDAADVDAAPESEVDVPPEADALAETPVDAGTDADADTDTVTEASVDAEAEVADVVAAAEVPAPADARMTELEAVIGELSDKLAMLSDGGLDSSPVGAVSHGFIDSRGSERQLSGLDDALRAELALVSPSLQTTKQFALALDAAEQRLAAVEARSRHERAALEQQLALALLQRDESRTEAEATLLQIEERHAAAMEAAQQRIAEVEARLEQVQKRLEELSGAQTVEDADSDTDAAAPADVETEASESAPSAGLLEPNQLAEQQELLAELEGLRQERSALRQELEQALAEPANDAATPQAFVSGEHRAALDAAEQRISALHARLEQESTALQQQLAVVRAQREEAAEGVRNDLSKAHATEMAMAEQRIRALAARLEQERLALQQQLEVVRAQRDTVASEIETRLSKAHGAELDAAKTRIGALQARLDQERTALQQQLEVVRSQRDMRVADAASGAEPLVADGPSEADLDAARKRVAAMQARLDQERLALQQQLDVVRAQRDTAASDVESRLTKAHSTELQAAKQRIRALQARLAQERTALQQQLEVVREQRDGAADALQAQLAKEHAAALAAMEKQVRAARAKLDNQRTALEQQLALVRAQRDAAAQERDARPSRLEYEKALRDADRRVRAALARLDNERTALQQQLAVVRAQRGAAQAEIDQRVQALAATHQKELAELQASIAAREAWHEQEREALQQQLEVARVPRDAAPVESAPVIAEVTTVETVEAVPESGQSLAETAAELGGQLTENGILLSLGGDQLQFASGSAALPARELPSLDRMAATLSARPELTARIEGHTDSAGGAALNQALSRQRAEAVMQALIDRGVDPARLSAEGLGEENPIADNGTAQGRSQNRRVEIYVVGADSTDLSGRQVSDR